MPTTYAELKKAVQAFSGRTDQKTLAQIPAFIRAAETHLDGNLRVPSMTVTKQVNADGLSIPLTIMELEQVLINGQVGLLMGYDEIVQRRLLVDESRAYAIVGANMEIVAPALIDLTGWNKPQRLADMQQENAYTKEAENALLWQALSVLGVFTRDSKAAQAWAGLAATEISNLNMQFEKFKSGAGVQNVAGIRTF
ncbi:hypothetical protein [Buttiauxella sp. A111]|uniref:phage adaptor protein n=1 Tax=Buttiauxella sp. A111 TaxID=2563088 RepID=UPI0010DCF52E|nr:hypothetical protein [Buttiauxella sp. A111]GDX06340.1 hypothetical protein BSPA111_25490 [Buttiauxella sp. A111]